MDPHFDDPAAEQLLARLQSHEPLVLGEKERHILALLDEEEELRLEKRLLEAQAALASDDSSGLSDADVASQLAQAEKDALEARATYLLRNKIIQNALIADPILKAVHLAPGASRLERDLLPSVTTRDVLAMLHGKIATDLSTANGQNADAEHDIIDLIATNRSLAAKMLNLAEAAKAEKSEALNDVSLSGELEELDRDIKEAQKEWRVVKSVVAGIVASSGVDWASDQQLLKLVLDEDEDGG